MGVLDVTETDLVAYRKRRLESGISTRSWARQLVVIRALFGYLFETGQRNSLPWVKRWEAVPLFLRGPHRSRWMSGHSRTRNG